MRKPAHAGDDSKHEESQSLLQSIETDRRISRFATLPVTASGPVWIANNYGYFHDEGLDINIKQFSSGRTALTTMLNERSLDVVTVETPVM